MFRVSKNSDLEVWKWTFLSLSKRVGDGKSNTGHGLNICGGVVINSRLIAGIKSNTGALSALISARLKRWWLRSGDSGIGGLSSSYLSCTGLWSDVRIGMGSNSALNRTRLKRWQYGSSRGGRSSIWLSSTCTMLLSSLSTSYSGTATASWPACQFWDRDGEEGKALKTI